KHPLPTVQRPASARPPLRLPLLPKPLAHGLDVQIELPTDLLLAQTLLSQGTYCSPDALLDQRLLRGAFRRHGQHLLFLADVHPYTSVSGWRRGGFLDDPTGGNLGRSVTPARRSSTRPAGRTSRASGRPSSSTSAIPGTTPPSAPWAACSTTSSWRRRTS